MKRQNEDDHLDSLLRDLQEGEYEFIGECTQNALACAEFAKEARENLGIEHSWEEVCSRATSRAEFEITAELRDEHRRIVVAKRPLAAPPKGSPSENAHLELLALLYEHSITKGAAMEAGKGGVADIEMLKFVNTWPRSDTAPNPHALW